MALTASRLLFFKTHADTHLFEECIDSQRKGRIKRIQGGFVPVFPLSDAEWDVNVALLPSTVRLPKMFWRVCQASRWHTSVTVLRNQEGLGDS